MTKITAIVPMRHHSERVPHKNYRHFAGQPLYRWIIQILLQCDSVSEIVIDTDSQPIMQDAAKHFPQVGLLERPQHLRDGTTSMNDVLAHAVGLLEGEIFLQTHSTNPLLKPETIERGIAAFLANQNAYDSLFTVTQIQKRLWDAAAQPLNHDPDILLRTQDLPALYEENSCYYIFSKDTFLRRHNRLGERPLMFEISRHEAWDIDDEDDFEIAQLMFEHQHKERDA